MLDDKYQGYKQAAGVRIGWPRPSPHFGEGSGHETNRMPSLATEDREERRFLTMEEG